MERDLDERKHPGAVITLSISSTVLSDDHSSALRKLFMSSLETLPYVSGIDLTRSVSDKSRLPSGDVLAKSSRTYEIFISLGEIEGDVSKA